MDNFAPQNIPHKWLTTTEAARYLGCCRNFLDRDRLSRLSLVPMAAGWLLSR